MLLSQIRPFVRYAREMTLPAGSAPSASVVPLDARLFYVASGCGVMETPFGTFRAEPGSVLLINPGIPYRYGLSNPKEPVSFLVLNFDYTQDAAHVRIPVSPKLQADFSPEDILTAAAIDDAPELSGALLLPGMHRIAEGLKTIVREDSRKIYLNETKTSGLLTDVLVECVRELCLAPAGGSGVDGILDYLHGHFREPVTNADLGARFGFHPNYVSALIKKYTGMPLHKYLNHVRISHALKMLDEGDPTVGEMAAECGFCDLYYFSRTFRAAVGTSPAAYRKRRKS